MCANRPTAAENGKTIQVLLVEEDQRAADAIVRDFGHSGVGVTAVRTLADARAALRQGARAVDIVIFELHLPDGRGESLLPDIEECPRQPMAIITSAFLADLRADALEYRPVAVAKPVGTAALLRIVKTVAAGYVRPVIGRFAKRFDLSRRETQTIALLSQGHGAKEIASRLACSQKTVYFHLAHICRKTKCRDYHEITGRLFAFTCQALGHTPPEHPAFVDPRGRSREEP